MREYSTDLNLLMADLGLRSGVEYSCDGSGSFLSYLGLALSGYQYELSSNSTDISLFKSEIMNGRPMLFSGCAVCEVRTSGWWIFKVSYTVPDNCHMWVCDGYREVDGRISTCPAVGRDRWSNCDTYRIVATPYLHLNWGWNGDSNGWFNAIARGASQKGRRAWEYGGDEQVATGKPWTWSYELDNQSLKSGLAGINVAQYASCYPFVHHNIKPR